MPWIESHAVLIRHRKLKDLARTLKVEPVTALGHLHALWHTAIEQAEDGDLSKWSSGAIADAAQWVGSEKEFLEAVFSSGFMDKGQLLHDWLDYAGRYLTSKYKTSNHDRLREIWAKFGRIYGKEFLKTDESSPKESPPYLPTLTKPTIPYLPTNPLIGEWLSDSEFASAWKDWEKARKKKAGTRQYGVLRKLASDDMKTAIAILNQSADNQYTGLFPLKKAINTSAHRTEKKGKEYDEALKL